MEDVSLITFAHLRKVNILYYRIQKHLSDSCCYQCKITKGYAYSLYVYYHYYHDFKIKN